MSIIFKEDSHQYFNTDTNEEYLSGTRFLHLFEPIFDKDGISKRVAKREGKTQEEVLNEWANASKKACDYGTQIHKVMEDYIKFGEYQSLYKSLYNSFEKIVGKDFKNSQEILSESLLWNHEYKIAGQADLIIVHNDDEFSVGDFKTNKEIQFFSAFGNRMLHPVDHLSQCQHNLYALQLSLYAYMYSLLTGKKLRRIFIMYKDGDSWTHIPCNYMLYEIKLMLKYYKEVLQKQDK